MSPPVYALLRDGRACKPRAQDTLEAGFFDGMTAMTIQRFLGATAMALAALGAPAAMAADVGVSIAVSQPGVYGRIDVGRYPSPVVIGPQPVVVAPAVVAAQPVYMWVPPGHQRNWSRHCKRYGACGVPVYFVTDGWYQQHVIGDREHHAREFDRDRYAPRGSRDDGPGRGRGRGRSHDD
jgi:hypothetical protein